MDKTLYKPFEEKMQKTFDALKQEISHIRAGRANPAVLEKVMVPYYGTMTPVAQIGNVNVPEARSIVIQPWDPKLLGEIEKAIQKSDIGINPINDGKVIRLTFPPLTEERRKELIKVIHKYGEEAKVSMRTIRRDAIDHFKNDRKKSDITEDDLREMEKDIQKVTDKHIEDIDKMLVAKEKELMEV